MKVSYSQTRIVSSAPLYVGQFPQYFTLNRSKVSNVGLSSTSIYSRPCYFKGFILGYYWLGTMVLAKIDYSQNIYIEMSVIIAIGRQMRVALANPKTTNQTFHTQFY